MAENELYEAKSFTQLADLFQSSSFLTPTLCNNAYFFREYSKNDMEIAKIVYQKHSNGLAIFFDMGPHYRFVFSFDPRVGYTVPTLDKKICCEFIISENASTENIYKSLDGFLTANGFKEQERFFQMRYSPDTAYRISVAKYKEDVEYISGLGMHTGVAAFSEVPEIEALIRDNISEYDTMNFTPQGWERQLQQQNVTCIYKQREIAAIHCYAPDGSRTVVAPAYKGLHLGMVCKRLFHTQERWRDEKKSIYTWTRPNNTAAIKMMREIAGADGVIMTGKMKYRYVKPVKTTV